MFSLRILRSISRKPPCLPRRIGVLDLVGVALLASVSFFFRSRNDFILIALFSAHAPEWFSPMPEQWEQLGRPTMRMDVVGRVEHARVDAAVEDRDGLAEHGHLEVAQGEADGDDHLAVLVEQRRDDLVLMVLSVGARGNGPMFSRC